MPLIEVTITTGRDPAVVQDLMSRLHRATVDALGASPERVRVVLRELPPEHWMIGGETVTERRVR